MIANGIINKTTRVKDRSKIEPEVLKKKKVLIKKSFETKNSINKLIADKIYKLIVIAQRPFRTFRPDQLVYSLFFTFLHIHFSAIFF